MSDLDRDAQEAEYLEQPDPEPGESNCTFAEFEATLLRGIAQSLDIPFHLLLEDAREMAFGPAVVTNEVSQSGRTMLTQEQAILILQRCRTEGIAAARSGAAMATCPYNEALMLFCWTDAWRQELLRIADEQFALSQEAFSIFIENEPED